MKSSLFAALVLLAAAATSTAADTPNRLVLHPEQAKTKIDRNIYGHFAEHLGHCIYEGLWVGEDSPIPNTRGIRNDVVAALKAIKIPVLRWPGGCFADEYHWMDGIGPREQRLETLAEIRRRLVPGAPLLVAHISFPQTEPERSTWIARHVAYGQADDIDPALTQKKLSQVNPGDEGRLSVLAGNK